MILKSTKIVESENARFICLYANNSRDIYFIVEWLRNCLLKRLRNGKAVLLETLENCSAVRKCVCMASKMLLEYDSIKATNEEKRTARAMLAEQIVEEARSLYDMECRFGKEK